MNVKLLIEHHLEGLSLTGGYTGSSESTLVKMLHCWKSHVTADFIPISSLQHVVISSGIQFGKYIHPVIIYDIISFVYS